MQKPISGVWLICIALVGCHSAKEAAKNAAQTSQETIATNNYPG